ncbi:hypothetical protein R75465_03900 [Paraburkholderia aspalathi]|nr:hypothetical protein R75465_03900 [Paraburkholderia aspalathi]
MSRYEMYSRTPFFECEILTPRASEDQQIVIDSVFWGAPESVTGFQAVDYAVVLDTNVFNFIRQKPDSESVQLLLQFAQRHRLTIDPGFALIEQRLRHGNPDRALEQYRSTLKADFGISISDVNINRLISTLESLKPNLEYNVALLRDYLPLIKEIWKSTRPFEDQVKTLSECIISEELPRFTFAYLFAATAFFVKHNPDLFDAKVAAKIQSDMAISPKAEKEAGRLWNVAHDLALFAYCIETTLQEGSTSLHISTIASADVSFPVFCRNIKAAIIQHEFDPETGRYMRLGHFGLTPLGEMDKACQSYVMQLLPRPELASAQIKTQRRARLAALARRLESSASQP